MEVLHYQKSKAKKRGETTYFVRVNHGEALRIVASLVEQLRTNSPNAGREEMWTEKGEYFSIAVTPSAR